MENASSNSKTPGYYRDIEAYYTVANMRLKTRGFEGKCGAKIIEGYEIDSLRRRRRQRFGRKMPSGSDLRRVLTALDDGRGR